MDYQSLIYIVPSALIAIIFHEMAHGFISYKLGDPTPKLTKRLSLNPLNHLDPVGTLCLILFRFGWAKPVLVNPEYYKNKKLGMVLVAFAGPLTNFILAFLSLFVLALILKSEANSTASQHILSFFLYLAIINIGLGTFNMFPIPPLDGSKILGAIIPEKYYFQLMRYESYGMFLLVMLLMTGVLQQPLRWILTFVREGMLSIIYLILGM